LKKLFDELYAIKMLFLIVLLTRTLSHDDDSLSICDLFEDPIEMLKCEVEELLERNKQLKLSMEEMGKSSNFQIQQLKLSMKEMEASSNFKIQQLEMSIEEGRTSENIQNQVLRKISKVSAGLSSRCNQHACGPCACYTDYQLDKNYYCNCEHLEPMRDCLAFRDAGYNISGLYLVHMKTTITVEVYCDQETDNGGWTVFQRRLNGRTNFYRDWISYKEGFGNPQREFWLGNENIYLLTWQAEWPEGSELRIDLEDWSHKSHYAKYLTFSIDQEEQKYKLLATGYSGDVGDSLGYHNGQMFSTYDADNDDTGGNCASVYRGAWWYKDCLNSNLNGEYRLYGEEVPYARGVIWYHYQDHYYSMKFSEMKVRRKQ